MEQQDTLFSFALSSPSLLSYLFFFFSLQVLGPAALVRPFCSMWLDQGVHAFYPSLSFATREEAEGLWIHLGAKVLL